MRGIKKGSTGYIRMRRNRMHHLTLLLLAADLIMFFTAQVYFGSNRNLFSIFAALICLPIAKCGVSAIVLFRARGCSAGAEEQIRRHVGALDHLYELYLTSYSRNFQISHAAFACKNIVAFTETRDCDGPAAEKHIRDMLENNGMRGYSVKLFFSLDRYLDRLDSLNRLAEQTEKEDLRNVRELLLVLSI
ncbi:hypothetical protein [Lachnoclostridium sp. Marseille-P6806]|uniref:hypothetical protein n=1 Tax=Lachnoclostridium sp. Marseille-P6806 TaxID=2364793 RepID=UPI001030D193|nr:hypothetical protein [Lachnoclostridium sp. Marseille-P6806]